MWMNHSEARHVARTLVTLRSPSFASRHSAALVVVSAVSAAALPVSAALAVSAVSAVVAGSAVASSVLAVVASAVSSALAKLSCVCLPVPALLAAGLLFLVGGASPLSAAFFFRSPLLADFLS